MSKHWTLDDIDWDGFQPSQVDPQLLATIKTAAMVEGNFADGCDHLSSCPERIGFSSAPGIFV